jgi:hypothetical protein
MDGHHQRAEAIARSIDYPERRACALANVARGLAAAGQNQQAGIIARSIDDPGWRVEALVDVAEALISAGALEAASQLTAAACAAGECTIAMRPALRLAPSAAALVLRMLEEPAVELAHE